MSQSRQERTGVITDENTIRTQFDHVPDASDNTNDGRMMDLEENILDHYLSEPDDDVDYLLADEDDWQSQVEIPSTNDIVVAKTTPSIKPSQRVAGEQQNVKTTETTDKGTGPGPTPPALTDALGSAQQDVPAKNNDSIEVLWSFPSSALRDWPVRPARALYGPMGEIVKAIEPHTEADPMAIYLQLLAAYGNVIDRSGYVKAEADKHYTNLFVALVGRTAAGRKGTSHGYVRKVMEIFPFWSNNRNVAGLSSGEGLINAVKDEDPTNPGEGEKRLFVVESEFASTLKVMARDGNTLSAILRQAWDGVPLHVLTRNSPLQATNTHISIVVHITREELRREMSSTDMANGFANRFLWVCTQRSKYLSEGGNFDPRSIAPFMEQLRKAVDFAKNVAEVKRDEAARAYWAAEYRRLSTPPPGLLGSVTSRAEAQVTRLALILALLDCSNAITPEHLEAALAIWHYCLASARYIFGGSLGNRVVDEILAELKVAGANGLTRTEIRDKFSRNKSAVEINDALASLSELGLAEQFQGKTRGRPSEAWRVRETIIRS